MKPNVKGFADSAKGFTKSPLGIIALFIVLVYGFASLVVSFGQNIGENAIPLIYFLVVFPVIVFFGFLWLVANHHKKLYGPSDFKDEDNFVKVQMSTAMSLAAASAKQPNDELNPELSDKYQEKILELVNRTSQREKIKTSKNRIIWVDDRPENNIYERKAFEAQGIEFSLALNTNEALELIRNNDYVAIISDMGRKEGPKEGYKLLDAIRESGNKTPFFIYAGSRSEEHNRMTKQRGGQGTTNRADELYEMVMNSIQ
ncbi:response regulator [Psychroserpens sp.]|uniref:response regulator n=1 Tax=Psychroserpens sp. TaxID=2020870 RepID=UPI001B24FDBB|nr:response regulator [Psychroserpens sp.]MBO6606253.1 response regulator [Psychroserpens sp.]MBO6630939.1 response regulator [Psychroserpens sp.]MBO6652375.1 response regulator [Psychroserpens sp.]MBO6681853.1 response regulator [Psychroserpens sp.]MBO6749628.1 response regulator [Psychroserpens sp.]